LFDKIFYLFSYTRWDKYFFRCYLNVNVWLLKNYFINLMLNPMVLLGLAVFHLGKVNKCFWVTSNCCLIKEQLLGCSFEFLRLRSLVKIRNSNLNLLLLLF
jgi:hypothetical protein